jgi:PTH1 family peptidyl-tRNA hydrolase
VARLLVGLGNPGPEYDWTPHNLGFHVLDHVVGVLDRGVGADRAVARWDSFFRPASSLEGYDGPRGFSWARVRAPGALAIKPGTFMNRSGSVVAPLSRWLGAAPEEVLVVLDDLDLELGYLRARPHGSSGGHQGLESILTELGTDRVPRLRVGIGRPRTDAARHVLTPLPPAQRVEAEISVAQAAEFAFEWMRGGSLDELMTRYHSRWNQGRT